MAFIVDTYNKYNKWDREHSQFHFKINDAEYAIKEINDILELPRSIEDNTSLSTYFIYSQYEDALRYVHTIRSLN